MNQTDIPLLSKTLKAINTQLAMSGGLVNRPTPTRIIDRVADHYAREGWAVSYRVGVEAPELCVLSLAVWGR